MLQHPAFNGAIPQDGHSLAEVRGLSLSDTVVPFHGNPQGTASTGIQAITALVEGESDSVVWIHELVAAPTRPGYERGGVHHRDRSGGQQTPGHPVFGLDNPIEAGIVGRLVPGGQVINRIPKILAGILVGGDDTWQAAGIRQDELIDDKRLKTEDQKEDADGPKK